MLTRTQSGIHGASGLRGRFSKVADPGGWPILSISPAQAKSWVPLDKSEGGVKDKSILSVFLAPFFCQEIRGQTERSRVFLKTRPPR
jgi:hypothetical protein